MILALGKDGKAYLLDRNNLGGIGGSLAVETVDTRAIITAPAAYPAADGVFVACNYPPAEPGALFSVSRSKRLEGDADASPAYCAT